MLFFALHLRLLVCLVPYFYDVFHFTRGTSQVTNKTVLRIVSVMLPNLHKRYNCMHDLPIQYTTYASE